MVGGAMRRVQSLYQRVRPRPAPPSDGGEGPLAWRRRRRTTRRTEEENQVPPRPPSWEEQEPAQDADEAHDDATDQAQDDGDEAQVDAEEAPTAAASTSSGTFGVYLRGPASLPQRPIPAHQRPLI